MQSASIFFDFLARNGLTQDNLEHTIAAWDLVRLVEFHNDFHTYSPTSPHDQGTVYNFHATREMSGGAWPCGNIQCRTKNVNHLARFTALYADHVILQPPISYTPPKAINTLVIQHLINSLRVVYFFEPLLRSGLVSFAQAPPKLCDECLQKSLGINMTLKDAAREVIHAYLPNVKSSIGPSRRRGGYTEIRLNGPTELFEHGEQISTRQGAVDKFSNMSLEDLVMDYLDPVLFDIVQHHFSAVVSGGNFLASRQLHCDLIKTMHSQSPDTRNRQMMDALSHHLPFVQDVPLVKLIELRQKDGESFELYRQAVSAALKAAPNADDRHLAELFTDQVRPELARIDLTLRNSRRYLYGTIALDAVVLAGFVGIGLFSGLLPYDMDKVLAAIGGYKCLTDLKGKIDQLRKDTIGVNQNKFYFLWKVRNERMVV